MVDKSGALHVAVTTLVPIAHREPALTLSNLLDRAAFLQPNREAFVDTTKRYTYAQARTLVDSLAFQLLRLGVRPSERVLIQLPNWPEFGIAYFACQKIGAITVLLIERYRPFEIGRLLNLTGATAWIAPRQTGNADFAPIIADVVDAHPEVRHVITVRGKIDRPESVSLEELMEGNAPTGDNLFQFAQGRPNPHDVAHMAPTGGTSGELKVVPRTHESLLLGVEFCSASWDQHCEDINMIVGPVGHDLSFTKGLLGSIITTGKLVFQESRKADDICETIEREEVTAIVCVPTLAQRILENAKLDRFDLSSLRKVHVGGGASHRDMAEGYMKRLGVRLYSGYGGTEGMTTITRSGDDFETVCSTVGRPTCPYDTYKVVDPNGQELPPNKAGELLVKGPGIFSGYYNNPEINAAAFDSEGFFKTGDIARIREDGYITIIERRKDIIKRGGESISAADIETLINLHPQVAAVAVVPMPDPIMGERACAYIEPKPNISLTEEEVIKFLKERKAAVLQLPERIEFIDKLPVTVAEKVDKQLLRKDIESRLNGNTHSIFRQQKNALRTDGV
jgi:non-ribosomal peptide synthetase component E (peptide arylation enzyme)